METLLTEPDEEVLKVVEEWNARPDLHPKMRVDIDFVRDYVISIEYDKKRKSVIVEYLEGLDRNNQLILISYCMIVYGGLYWQNERLSREEILLRAYIEGNTLAI